MSFEPRAGNQAISSTFHEINSDKEELSMLERNISCPSDWINDSALERTKVTIDHDYSEDWGLKRNRTEDNFIIPISQTAKHR